MEKVFLVYFMYISFNQKHLNSGEFITSNRNKNKKIGIICEIILQKILID